MSDRRDREIEGEGERVVGEIERDKKTGRVREREY